MLTKEMIQTMSVQMHHVGRCLEMMKSANMEMTLISKLTKRGYPVQSCLGLAHKRMAVAYSNFQSAMCEALDHTFSSQEKAVLDETMSAKIPFDENQKPIL